MYGWQLTPETISVLCLSFLLSIAQMLYLTFPPHCVDVQLDSPKPSSLPSLEFFFLFFFFLIAYLFPLLYYSHSTKPTKAFKWYVSSWYTLLSFLCFLPLLTITKRRQLKPYIRYQTETCLLSPPSLH